MKTLLLALCLTASCGYIPTGVINNQVPTAPDPRVDSCNTVNYAAQDTGDGLSPLVSAASVQGCGTSDSEGYSCAACAWPVVNYVSATSGLNIVAQPKSLPSAGCWYPTAYTTSVVCFDSCGIAAGVCR